MYTNLFGKSISTLTFYLRTLSSLNIRHSRKRHIFPAYAFYFLRIRLRFIKFTFADHSCNRRDLRVLFVCLNGSGGWNKICQTSSRFTALRIQRRQTLLGDFSIGIGATTLITRLALLRCVSRRLRLRTRPDCTLN